jgi:hypothetical protein
MPIEPVKIPQNVQVEDHIIGPITMRQLILLIIGAAISFAIWNVTKAAGFVDIFSLAVSWSPVVIMAAFAFVKVNDLSLLRIIFLIVEGMQKPSHRTFGPRPGVAINVQTYYRTQSKTTSTEGQTHIAEEKLQSLSKLLDEGAPNEVEQTEVRVRDTAEDDESPSRPVDPRRVKVETPKPKSANVDTIASPSKTNTPSTQTPLIRDVHPPAQS